ncbi:hypothetical protein M9458_023146 [Cirrhinus mrigala]|uniref:Uncharacterized protein n=1 Tax=Cirrhinus mrigala TaxID=683832 RepID=A0ABD0Q3T3_CIRMR
MGQFPEDSAVRLMSPNARLYFGPLPSGSFITPTGKRKESLQAALLSGQGGRQPEAIRPPSETPVRKIRSQSNPEYSRIQARRRVFLKLAILGHYTCRSDHMAL